MLPDESMGPALAADHRRAQKTVAHLEGGHGPQGLHLRRRAVVCHACGNLPPNVPAIYIGADQRKVLVDERLDPVLSFGEFVNAPVHDWDRPPAAFKVQDCLMVSPGPA